ncbi:MAG: superoxide dismutase [Candidatus Kerfeldbacteria bacterium]|nr:superoxide dismutase [Candidatus Kerfeldbacteria bacterium]
MFKLPDLPYAYNALEPYLDAATMEIHHGKHHATYVVKLNEALANQPELFNKTIEELILNLNSVPEKIRSAVRNHGGGHYNHSLFWLSLSPVKSEPAGELMDLLNRDFSSLENFKGQFTKAALGVFGSGWTWLVKDQANKLMVITTANQDSPLSQDLKPLLCLDVWEHAYYLKFQNRRTDYVTAWWSVVNWLEVAKRLS